MNPYVLNAWKHGRQNEAIGRWYRRYFGIGSPANELLATFSSYLQIEPGDRRLVTVTDIVITQVNGLFVTRFCHLGPKGHDAVSEKVVSDDYRRAIRSMSLVPAKGVGPSRRGEAR